MKIHVLESSQKLEAPVEKVWDFFSSPENLNKITPEDFQFNIISTDANEKIYPGKIIEYKVSPFKFMPKMHWVTEISQVIENELFIDEQRFGPYKFWHHKHIFIDKGDYVLMKDIVHYSIGFGVFGEIAHKLFIKKRLNFVFEYRKKVIDKYF
jgi:ligand-binding SRPBCC domain-containing protein